MTDPRSGAPAPAGTTTAGRAPGGGGGAPSGLSAAATAFTPASVSAAGPSRARGRRRQGSNADDGRRNNNASNRRGRHGRGNTRRGRAVPGAESGARGNDGQDGQPAQVPAGVASPNLGDEDAKMKAPESSSSYTRRGSSKRGGRGRGSSGQGRGRGGRGRGREENWGPPAGSNTSAVTGPDGSGGGGGGGGGGSGANRDQGSTNDRPLCIVCADEIQFFAVGECNHPGRCSTCAMRSRVLLKDRSCPECKTVLDRLVVAELPSGGGDVPRFESFGLWGDFAGPGSRFDDASGMVFYRCEEHYDSIRRLTGLFCPVVGCAGASPLPAPPSAERTNDGDVPFSTKAALLQHMAASHQRFLCLLCLENRPLFVSEQEVFTATGLKKHEAKVEGGHPLCHFCNKRFFDKAALYDHMTATHITCHLCPEVNQHRYFRGEPQLRDHLRTSHFLCDRGNCRRQGVISAFNTPQEFQAHLLQDHGINDRRAAPAGGIGFNIRRAARDGTGLHSSGSSMAYATTPVAPGDSFAAPDPELDLAGGILVPVPASRGRGPGTPSFETPSVFGSGNHYDALGRRDGLSVGAGRGGEQRGASVAAAVRGLGRAPRGLQEAFPSLPTAPTRSAGADAGVPQERHALSLVGKTLRSNHHDNQSRAAKGGGATKGGGGDGVAGASEKESDKRKLLRNKRLADALGIRAALGAGAAIGGAKIGTTASGTAVAVGIGDGLDAIREHLARTHYSPYLVDWARANRTELAKLERRLAELVSDRKATSTQLKPMPSVDRKAVHELAVAYGLLTQSFDLEPKRYVSVIKQPGCRLPSRLLSTAALDPSYKGVEEAMTDASASASASASAPALERTSTNPNPRAVGLSGQVETVSTVGGGSSGMSLHSPMLGRETPRTSAVISISSGDPLAAAPATSAAAAAGSASVEGKATSNERGKRPGVPPPEAATAVAGKRGGGGEGGAVSAGIAPTPAAPLGTGAATNNGVAERPRTEYMRGGVQGKGREKLETGAADAQQTKQPRGSEDLTGSRCVVSDDKKFRGGNDKRSPPSSSAAAAATGSTPTAVNGSQGKDENGSEATPAAAAGPLNPECLLIFHSVQAGLGERDAILASVRSLVPARTVVGVRSATAAEAATASDLPVQRGGGGGATSGGALVMEFTSEQNARRAWEKIEREAEQLLAAARVTRTAYQAPFRAKLYPSSPPDAGVGGGRRGDDGTGVVGIGSDVVRDNWDDSSDDEGGGGDRGDGRNHSSDSSVGQGTLGAGQIKGGGDSEEHAVGAVEEDADHEGETQGWDGEEEDASGSPAAARAAVAPTPPAAASGAAGKRPSKWKNSVLKGRLQRPSDGRATTVELEAMARRERLEKLRSLEEARREMREKRVRDRRTERLGADAQDPHALMWGILAHGSSSSSDDDEEKEENDDDERHRRTTKDDSQQTSKWRKEGDASEPSPGSVGVGKSEESRLIAAAAAAVPSEGGDEGGERGGWGCGVCTFWNDGVEDGGQGIHGGGVPRCGVCGAEGPRNALSPWLPA